MIKTAILLTAGKGRKCWPYSVTKNKCILPIANRPILLWMLQALHDAGIERVVAVTGYKSDQVAHALRDAPLPVSLVKSNGQGTAVDVATAWNELDDQKVLVCYGDLMINPQSIQDLIVHSRDHDTVGVALVDPLDQEPPQEWMCAQVKDHQLEQVLGHPRDDVSHRLCGIYVLDEKIKSFLTPHPGYMQNTQVGMMPPEESPLEDCLQFAIEKNETISAVPSKKPFVDIDSPWHLLLANEQWLDYLSENMQETIASSAKISDSAQIGGRVWIGENSEIGPGVIIEGDVWIGSNSTVTQGAIIEPRVHIGNHCLIRRVCQIEHHTAVGDQCVVGHAAEVSGIMMRNSYAYHYGEYWGILGENTDLGAATVCGNLRFDDQQTMHRMAGFRTVPRYGANAAYLGDYVRTGVNVILMPGVKIGPYSVVGAGTVVDSDVPENSLIYVQQQLVKKTWGPERYGW
jgi:UDP-N-acetylglucosamine diphosphorylase / glucose-1-phosphate thymidylyltransferase / UDP-N-acetylgalactosamine diphosphorylase / glucosamine-1-phosphate N-acetyltransferase / galactosamine-1-phosphate N-acetyltransferase